MNRQSHLTPLAVALVALVAPACVTRVQQQGPVEPGAGIVFDRARIETADGRTALELMQSSDGIHLLDARRRIIGRYAIGERTISVSDGRRVALGKIKRGTDEFVLSPVEPARPDVRLMRERDGDLRLENGAATLFELKRRDYGYKIVDPSGKTLGRVRVGSERISVRNGARQTVRVTRAPLSAASVAFLVLPNIELVHSAGFAVAATVWGLPE